MSSSSFAHHLVLKPVSSHLLVFYQWRKAVSISPTFPSPSNTPSSIILACCQKTPGRSFQALLKLGWQDHCFTLLLPPFSCVVRWVPAKTTASNSNSTCNFCFPPFLIEIPFFCSSSGLQLWREHVSRSWLPSLPVAVTLCSPLRPHTARPQTRARGRQVYPTEKTSQW